MEKRILEVYSSGIWKEYNSVIDFKNDLLKDTDTNVTNMSNIISDILSLKIDNPNKEIETLKNKEYAFTNLQDLVSLGDLYLYKFINNDVDIESNFTKAMEYYQKAYDILEEHYNDTNLIDINMFIRKLLIPYFYGVTTKPDYYKAYAVLSSYYDNYDGDKPDDLINTLIIMNFYNIGNYYPMYGKVNATNIIRNKRLMFVKEEDTYSLDTKNEYYFPLYGGSGNYALPLDFINYCKDKDISKIYIYLSFFTDDINEKIELFEKYHKTYPYSKANIIYSKECYQVGKYYRSRCILLDIKRGYDGKPKDLDNIFRLHLDKNIYVMNGAYKVHLYQMSDIIKRLDEFDYDTLSTTVYDLVKYLDKHDSSLIDVINATCRHNNKVLSCFISAFYDQRNDNHKDNKEYLKRILSLCDIVSEWIKTEDIFNKYKPNSEEYRYIQKTEYIAYEICKTLGKKRKMVEHYNKFIKAGGVIYNSNR